MFGFQNTIGNIVSCSGIGLHSGRTVSMQLLPAAEDSGIVFRQVDDQDNIIGEVRASYENVTSTMMSTNISSPDQKISIATVEHLMAAFWGCGIDNVIVKINGNEVPIMDGSSSYFVFMIECAGIRHQKKYRKILEITNKVELHYGDAFVIIEPSDEFRIDLGIDFAHPLIQKQDFHFDQNSNFKMDIARARTFGFEKDVEKLRSIGLAKGGSLDNAIVVGEDNILNPQGLRFNDEFVRHKILDSIGDMYLSGYHIKGAIKAAKSGHALNNMLLKKLFDNKEAWCYNSDHIIFSAHEANKYSA